MHVHFSSNHKSVIAFNNDKQIASIGYQSDACSLQFESQDRINQFKSYQQRWRWLHLAFHLVQTNMISKALVECWNTLKRGWMALLEGTRSHWGLIFEIPTKSKQNQDLYTSVGKELPRRARVDWDVFRHINTNTIWTILYDDVTKNGTDAWSMPKQCRRDQDGVQEFAYSSNTIVVRVTKHQTKSEARLLLDNIHWKGTRGFNSRHLCFRNRWSVWRFGYSRRPTSEESKWTSFWVISREASDLIPTAHLSGMIEICVRIGLKRLFMFPISVWTTKETKKPTDVETVMFHQSPVIEDVDVLESVTSHRGRGRFECCFNERCRGGRSQGRARECKGRGNYCEDIYSRGWNQYSKQWRIFC